ncbi:MAG: hypothetical protein AB2A00_23290 [Myxococcota bacterium]
MTSSRVFLAPALVLTLVTGVVRPAHAEPPREFHVQRRAMDVSSVLKGLPDRGQHVVAVVVVPPEVVEWQGVAEELQERLRHAVRKHYRVLATKGFKDGAYPRGKSDNELVRTSINRGSDYVLTARLAPAPRAGAAPQVVVKLMDKDARVLASMTNASWVVPGARRVVQQAASSPDVAGRTLEERLQEFRKRALRVRKTVYKWSSGRVGTDVDVVDVKGKALDSATLVEMAPTPELRESFARVRRDELMRWPVLLVPLGFAVAAPVAFPVVVTPLVFIPVFLVTTALGISTYGLAAPFLGIYFAAYLASGAAVVAFFVGIAAGLLTAVAGVAGRWVFEMFIAARAEDREYAALVTEHNLGVANELELNPDDLDWEYFPAEP